MIHTPEDGTTIGEGYVTPVNRTEDAAISALSTNPAFRNAMKDNMDYVNSAGENKWEGTDEEFHQGLNMLRQFYNIPAGTPADKQDQYFNKAPNTEKMNDTARKVYQFLQKQGGVRKILPNLVNNDVQQSNVVYKPKSMQKGAHTVPAINIKSKSINSIPSRKVDIDRLGHYGAQQIGNMLDAERVNNTRTAWDKLLNESRGGENPNNAALAMEKLRKNYVSGIGDAVQKFYTNKGGTKGFDYDLDTNYHGTHELDNNPLARNMLKKARTDEFNQAVDRFANKRRFGPEKAREAAAGDAANKYYYADLMGSPENLRKLVEGDFANNGTFTDKYGAQTDANAFRSNKGGRWVMASSPGQGKFIRKYIMNK